MKNQQSLKVDQMISLFDFRLIRDLKKIHKKLLINSFNFSLLLHTSLFFIFKSMPIYKKFLIFQINTCLLLWISNRNIYHKNFDHL